MEILLTTLVFSVLFYCDFLNKKKPDKKTAVVYCTTMLAAYLLLFIPTLLHIAPPTIALLAYHINEKLLGLLKEFL